jgi:hypothetical protein
MSGEEVVQLYTAFVPATPEDRSAGARSVPLRELKAFQRVAVSCPTTGVAGTAGAAGVATPVAVSFELKLSDLLLVDTDGSYTTIPGTYDVWIGGTGPGAQGKFVAAGSSAAPLHGVLTVLK